MNGSTAITMIGAGHMATHLLTGLTRAGFDVSQICITDKNPQKLNHLAQTFPVTVLDDNHAAIVKAQIVILAIKPQSLAAFANECADAFLHQPLVISILAGTSVAQLQALLGYQKIIRAMPNILVATGNGNTILFAKETIDATARQAADYFFKPLGLLQWVAEEQQLEAYTILTGAGPGYIFYLMQCLVDAAKALGIPPEAAKAAVTQLFSGAAQMANDSDESLVTLQQQVASKGGVTEKILTALAADKIDALLAQAFLQAYAHGQTLHAKEDQ